MVFAWLWLRTAFLQWSDSDISELGNCPARRKVPALAAWWL